MLCDGWKLQAADASEHVEGVSVTLVEQSRNNLGWMFYVLLWLLTMICRASIHTREEGPYQFHIEDTKP